MIDTIITGKRYGSLFDFAIIDVNAQRSLCFCRNIRNEAACCCTRLFFDCSAVIPNSDCTKCSSRSDEIDLIHESLHRSLYHFSIGILNSVVKKGGLCKIMNHAIYYVCILYKLLCVVFLDGPYYSFDVVHFQFFLIKKLYVHVSSCCAKKNNTIDNYLLFALFIQQIKIATLAPL